MLNDIQLNYLRENAIYKKDNPIVRFLDSQGRTVRLEDGYKHSKHENVIHKTFYWGVFSPRLIKYIENITGLRAVISK